ncbi:hypothetical protein QUB33_05900 [Microcoleus sp. B3-A4]|uniref:hypothetical protein n=1 Tax=Microcoleus sp. B3-A4 TaxID=2818653 RepID=UPI002FD28520
MERINFGGIQTEVLVLSPHHGCFIFLLSDRLAVKGVYTRRFTWDETTDNLKGFLSDKFVLYVGAHTYDEAELIKAKIIEAGGTPNQDVSSAKLVRGYSYQVRAIGLPPEYLLHTLQHFPHPHPHPHPYPHST